MKAATAALLALAILAVPGAGSAVAETAAAPSGVTIVARHQPATRPVAAKHWLSDGLQGLSLLLPRAKSRSNG